MPVIEIPQQLYIAWSHPFVSVRPSSGLARLLAQLLDRTQERSDYIPGLLLNLGLREMLATQAHSQRWGRWGLGALPQHQKLVSHHQVLCPNNILCTTTTTIILFVNIVVANIYYEVYGVCHITHRPIRNGKRSRAHTADLSKLYCMHRYCRIRKHFLSYIDTIPLLFWH